LRALLMLWALQVVVEEYGEAKASK
jgi:hypothetical protein